MLQRLAGLETEYAIRYTPTVPDEPRPGNDLIYDAISAAIQVRVHTRGGDRRLQRRQLFTENGGSVCYEALPWALDGGLVEGGTPECRGPGQLMLYQRAQDALLLQAAKAASVLLAEQGFHGDVGLLKNCRDADGNVYGAQENYELPLTSRGLMWFYRAGLVALLPLVLLTVALTWVLLVGMTATAVVALFALTILSVFIPSLNRWLIAQGAAPQPDQPDPRPSPPIHEAAPVPPPAPLALLDALDPPPPLTDTSDEAVPPLEPHKPLRPLRPRSRLFERRMGRVAYVLELSLWGPVMTLFSWWLVMTAFRRQRRALLPFLISRPVLTGAGTVLEDGTFGLSEKGPSIVRVMRSTPLSVDRAVFDSGNLLKHLSEPTMLQWSKLAGLFKRRQRLQLGLSDSNVAQLAEYLKIGVTALIVDMADAGLLHDAPSSGIQCERWARSLGTPPCPRRSSFATHAQPPR